MHNLKGVMRKELDKPTQGPFYKTTGQVLFQNFMPWKITGKKVLQMKRDQREQWVILDLILDQEKNDVRDVIELRSKYELYIRDYCYINVKFPELDHYILHM